MTFAYPKALSVKFKDADKYTDRYPLRQFAIQCIILLSLTLESSMSN